MILFFETYSVIQTLFLFRFIKRAEIIYFHKKSFPPLSYNPRVKIAVERLIRLFNMKVRIETLSAEKINENTWIMNKRTVDVVEELASEIQQTATYRTVLKITQDENILKCYNAQLVDDISARLLFFQAANDLIADSNETCFIIPADNDNRKIQKWASRKDTVNKYIPRVALKANRIRGFWSKSFALIIFPLLPAGYILKNARRITLRKINPKSFEIAMPILWGFHEGDIITSGVKWAQDDGYLYNDQIRPGQIIHIFNYWRSPPDTEAKYKSLMDKRDIPYIEKKNYKINFRLFLCFAKIQLKIIWYLGANKFYHNKLSYIWYSIKIIYWMLEEYLEFSNVDYRVELIRNDYSPGHIVKTILCNQNGKKTIGIQHGNTCGQYVMPSLCYVHFDKYCIFSDRHLELHSPFWNEVPLAKTGNYRIDYLVKLANNQRLLASIKNRQMALYGSKKYIVLILFPNPSEYSLMEKWNEVYSALSELNTLGLDCHVFLRFRDSKQLENSHLRRFKELPNKDRRIIIDLANFTTYELMAISDVVITSSHSSGMIDAVSINKKAFTFDYMGTAKYCFGKYGKDLILNTRDDVLNIFKGLENNFRGYDCNWELLRKEYNYYYDGRCLERLQKVMLETVEEVKEGTLERLKPASVTY